MSEVRGLVGTRKGAFVPDTPQGYDGAQHPWEFERVSHLEPSLTNPDAVYAGAEPFFVVGAMAGG